jgi:hypothetical protein
MTKSKVVLFIVEGINDKTALAVPLENLLSSENVKCEITDGDLTSDFYGKNIKAKVGEFVRQYCGKYKLKYPSSKKSTVSDVLEVVLLLDLDGAYVPESSIVQDNNQDYALYGESIISHKNPTELRKTQMRKQRNLNSLIGLNSVLNNIPFSVYFFSCNLDHVMCGNANLPLYLKRQEAETFEEKYCDNRDGFLSFFMNDKLIVSSDYLESWEFVKLDVNSLQRHSNLNVFLSLSAKSFPRSF